jgi:hypothetical protein
MKIEINEEINRYKLLMNYNSKKTLSENKIKLIKEGEINAAFETLFKQGSHDVELAKSITRAAEDGAINLKSLKTEAGKTFKTADEVVNSLKLGTLSAESTLEVSKSLLQKGSTEAVRVAAADAITSSNGFRATYAETTKAEMISRLKTKGGYTEEEARRIADSYTRTGGKFRTTPRTKKTTNVNQEKSIENTSSSTSSVGNIEQKVEIHIDSAGRELKTTAPGPIPEDVANAIENNKSVFTDIAEKVKKFRWNWKRTLKWAIGLGLTGLALWWFFHKSKDVVPDDIPPTPPSPNPSPSPEDGKVYTTPGDPYQYKVVECVWYTKSLENRGKIIKDWTSLANNQKAIGILDGRFPDARKDCGNNTTPQPPVTTTGSTTTQTPQDKLNQDYGVTPQPNAQAEVQTTNDDINNY